ncbi:hypothetical protein ABZ434_17300 [Streptomyces sp. NPDC005761]|uniref:hypothetical protein n=1 Tax=Streptomyces sp. NPDC005761 TaxID=3157066 RepID=UPI0033DADBD6
MALVGAAAAMVLGIGGAIAVADQDGGASGPTPVPSETSDGGTVGVSVGADSGTGDSGSVSGSGGTDGTSSGGADAGGSGGSDGGPMPSESPAPTDEPTSHPTGPASLDDLAERIDGLEKKVNELPSKKELAEALRAFADTLDHE